MEKKMDQDPNISYELPLSPVLSNFSKRKIIKRKKKSGTNLLNKIETESQTYVDKSQNITESQLNTAINSRSLEQQVDLQTSKEWKAGKSSGFQTASGKQFSLNKSSSEVARNLFGEILNPTVETHRENKFNFLSKKTKVSDFNSVTDTDFLGFNRHECNNHEKLNFIKYLKVALSSELKRSNTNIESDDSRINKKRRLITANESDPKSMSLGNISIGVPGSIEHINDSCKKVSIIKKKVSQLSNNLVSLEKEQERVKSEEIQVFEALKVEINEQLDHNTERKSSSNIEFQTTYFEDSGKKDLEYPKEKIENSNFQALKDGTTQTGTMNGFSTASGKNIKISAKSFSKINQMFKDISDNEIKHSDMRFEDSKNKIHERENFGETEVDATSELNLEVESKVPNKELKHNGFARASGRLMETPTNSFIKINTLSRPNFKQEKVSESLSIHCKNSSPKLHKGLNEGFSTASGNAIELPAASLARINNLFKDIPDLDPKTLVSDPLKIVKRKDEANVMKGFSTASGARIELPTASISKLSKIFGDIPDMNLQTISSDVENFESKPTSLNNENVSESNAPTKIESQENITPIRPIPRKKTLGSSLGRSGKISDMTMNRVKCLFSDINFDDLKLPGHSKANSPKVSFSTPLRPNGSISSPHFTKSFTPTPQARRSFTSKNGSFLNDIPQEYNCPFLIQKPTSGDLKSWAEDLSRQKKILEEKLSLLSKRYEAISAQINADSPVENTKDMKKKINKYFLRDLPEVEMQDRMVENINNVILQINPQNAALIHFNGNWSDIATVTTADGCTLIPNQQGLIGLSEIGAALESLPYVKKHLIPDGWIKNHYKWIIWKLASYERYFPTALGGSFTIDNVIKQLQYRYNREIFNAERPALRKIYEMDDVSQKRMILCISNIFKNGETIELELTDGWYSIRTLIDDLLCSQVNRKKIRIGSKLIIIGADLLNCEGCHPLETEQASKVRLKITFNSTRRAAWFCKLGYQKNPMPFLINLNSAQAAGGIIGAVKVYIMRVYPVIYMEKTSNSNIWRNQNAEEKKIQEFENKCYNEYERGIMNDEFKKRNVTPVFQMTVINAFGDKSKPFKCKMWNSTDFHVEQLKENKIINLYSLTLRSKNELSCNMKTRFENSNEDASQYAEYRRKYVPLNNIQSMLISPDFPEFDTVGFVVEIHVGKQDQYFWLTDSHNLLLVEIHESPENCLLLNRIQENQLIAICNINFINDFKEYSIAEANFHSVLTNYPQYTFLQDELMKLGQINKTELNILIENCKIKINSFSGEKNPNISDGNLLHSSQITCTDIAMSMINIDEVINNTK